MQCRSGSMQCVSCRKPGNFDVTSGTGHSMRDGLFSPVDIDLYDSRLECAID